MKNHLTVVSFFIVLFLPTISFAQSIQLTSPSTNVVHNEADDYFTVERDNPRDGTQVNGIGAWHENLEASSVRTENGLFKATLDGPGGYVMPLFPGFRDNLYPTHLAGTRSWSDHGITNKIDASKYKVLSYKLKHSSRSNFAIYWENDESQPQYLTNGTKVRATNDGIFNNQGLRQHPNNEFILYNYDLTDTSNFGSNAGNWDGEVFALRIDPSQGAQAGSTFEIDWVRLVPEADQQRTLTVTANVNGFFSNPEVRLYADNNQSGFNGFLVSALQQAQTTTNGQITFTVNTGIFPPGEYYFYTEAQTRGATAAADGPVLRSGYSAKLTVTARPRVYIQSPDFDSGREYAVDALNNAWDMDGSLDGNGDVANLANCEANGRAPVFCDRVFQRFTQASFPDRSTSLRGGRNFRVLADPPADGASESDVQIAMRVAASNPIDPRTYPYLVFRMEIDPTNYPSPSAQVEKGWVARVVPWNTDVVADGGQYKAGRVWQGMQTYVQDLRDPNVPEDSGALSGRATRWEEFSRVRNFRLDPGEFTEVATFLELDYMALYAENHTSNGQYTITFETSDSDSSTVNAEIYRDSDNQGFNGTLIGSLSNLSAGSHSFTWNGSGVSDGTKVWFYVKVTDSDGNVTQRYSQVHVNKGDFVAAPTPRSVRTRFDTDGDGTDDLIVRGARFGTTFNFVLGSTAGFSQQAIGVQSAPVVAGDFDGDNRADVTILTDVAGTLFWHVEFSGGAAPVDVPWGITGDKPVIGDYDGDGLDDIAIFRDSEGSYYVLFSSGGGIKMTWGAPGDKPVAEDYDGDGKTDYAVWRPSEGNWYIVNSGDGSVTVRQWGLPGDIPMPGDFTNDGKTDLAIWREANGTWYIQDVADANNTEVVPWGLPGDIPFVGDRNGDGNLDVVVYRPSFGVWFENFRNGLSRGTAFGLPGDLVPIRVDSRS